MTNSYDLDTLRADLDREFKPMTINVGGDEVVLRNLMRLGKKDRDAVTAALKDVQDLQDDSQDPEVLGRLENAVMTVLSIVPADGKGKKLVAAVDGDLALALKLMERWSEATQSGEAQHSPA